MEILKDFLNQVPIILRIIAYVIGLIFWTWFVFLYPTDISKNNIKDSSHIKNQTNIDTVKGDYVGRNKNVFNLYKTEQPSIKKIEQYPKYKTMTIKRGYTATLSFTRDNVFLYSVRFRWLDSEVLVLIKLPNEKEERAYKIADNTQLPFAIQINTISGTRILTVEKKLADGLQIRTFSEEASEKDS